ncbi:MAG: MotA/TolQ/ExbB proton channel family protein [Planctomycetota bacterium]
MQTRRWAVWTVWLMLAVVLVVLSGEAIAEEAGREAGVEKETMFTLIAKGGYLMIPLGIASILALTLGLERFISLSKNRVLPSSFLNGLISAWDGDRTGKQAIAYCDESGGAVGHIFKAGIRRASHGPEAVEKAIEDAGSKEADKMKRSLRPLSVIAAVSPLLGLLGTVYGMIDAFQKTASSGGTAKTAMLASGIYEALVTTAAGLTIAIPALLLYQFLLGRVDKLIDEIDEAGTEFIYSYIESHTNGPTPSPPNTPDTPPATPTAEAPTESGKDDNLGFGGAIPAGA